MDTIIPTAATIGVLLVFVFGILIMLTRFYRKVEQGNALIISKTSKVVVTFSGGVVVPVFHKAEYMDISVKTIEIERSARNGLICGDNIRADIKVSFYVRVNKAEMDVLKVAQAVGCERASAHDTLDELFSAKFSEALKTVGKQMEFTQLFTEREDFKEKIISVIGEDLNGYKLEDVAIDYLEQTPLESLDPDNILDAQGIRKITELTATEAVVTNEHLRNKEKVIKKQDVETREAILELEKQEADAEARQQREIANIQQRENAEIEKVKAEEHLKYERAQINTDEELRVAEQNKFRQIEIAEKAKERAVAVEAERVKQDQQLAAVERERLVAIRQVEKDKAVEGELKQIQEVIRERVIVEKTVATEQEKIKDTVEIAAAERDRKTIIIAAERDAQQKKLKEVAEAEAKEKAAKHLYEETIITAEGQRMSAEKEAEATKILAEASIAEQSAIGLAEVRVAEAKANAIEMTAKADAFGARERGEAEADAKAATYKADALGSREKGSAEADAMAATYKAEAEGLEQKAAAMKMLDGVGREHEEFKLELNKQKEIELAAINVNHKVAEAQAQVLGEAMKTANIDIVGGDGKFLDTFFKSISLAKSIDGFVEKSEVTQQLTNGDISTLGTKIKDLIASSGLNTEDIKNLSLSALLARLAKDGSGPVKGEAQGLLQQVSGMGGVKDVSIRDLMAMYMAK